jgi:hypothetical protein
MFAPVFHMKNPLREIQSLSEDEAEPTFRFMDKVRATLGDKANIYLTWTPDIRFGWKRKRGLAHVGCYLRWREKGSPAGGRPAVYYCSENVEGSRQLEEFLGLPPSSWKHYARCGHYAILETVDDAELASKAVKRLFELTS